ncbi:MAG: hydroxyacid dehydrogenase [Rhodospirillales bacterium]|nr:hydroxyacid dehydrogenase [Acetobacter sp.]
MQHGAHSTQTLEKPEDVAGLARQKRVVFALGPESQEHFLRHFDPASLPAAKCEAVDLPSLDPTAWEFLLCERQPDVLVTGWGTPTLPERYAAAPDLSLQYVCHLAGSVRQIVPRALIEKGVLVSNWGTLTSVAVAEHALLLTLGALRNLPAWNDYMNVWPRYSKPPVHLPLETRLLHGKRVGIHGFGSIARALVRMLAPFGVELAAYSRGVPAELFERHGVARCGSLKELFSRSDVLVECEALTPQNQGTVDAATLRCLPAGAAFINVGRGQLVDEDALAQIAVEKKLRLGLDVFCEEPLPLNSRLRTMPSALLSPHIAGPARDGLADLCKFAAANLQRYFNGQEIESQVSLEIYDRST